MSISLSDEGPYSFYFDLHHGRAITNDSPFFQVSLGRRSKVVYRDGVIELTVGAGFSDGTVRIDGSRLASKIHDIPEGSTIDDYALLVAKRIRAACAKVDRQLVVSGPLADRLNASARSAGDFVEEREETTGT